MAKGMTLVARIPKNSESDLALLRRDPQEIGTILDLQIWARRPGGGYTPCGTVSAKPEVWAQLLPTLARAIKEASG